MLAIFASASATLPGCGGEEPIAPPEIHFGQDVCDVCHMIISDDRYAAGLVTRDETNRRVRLPFDDIGCVFEFEQQHPQKQIEAVYVRGYDGGTWINAEQAVFVHSRDLETPMGFGLAALDDNDSAARVRNEYDGEVIDLSEARARFRRGELHVQEIPIRSLPTDADADADEDADESKQPTKRIELDSGEQLEIVLHTKSSLSAGKHPFEIELRTRRGSDEWRVSDAYAVRIEPNMPSMGHGSPGNEHPEHIRGGRYRGLVNFTMSGHWVVHVDVLEGDDVIGSVAFDFEVQR